MALTLAHLIVCLILMEQSLLSSPKQWRWSLLASQWRALSHQDIKILIVHCSSSFALASDRFSYGLYCIWTRNSVSGKSKRFISWQITCSPWNFIFHSQSFRDKERRLKRKQLKTLVFRRSQVLLTFLLRCWSAIAGRRAPRRFIYPGTICSATHGCNHKPHCPDLDHNLRNSDYTPSIRITQSCGGKTRLP